MSERAIEVVMWCVTLAAIVGAIANANGKIWCFPVWIFTNVSIAAYSIYMEAYSTAGLMIVYTFIAIYGWASWAKTKSNTKLPSREF